MPAVLSIDPQVVDMAAQYDIVWPDILRATNAAQRCFKAIVALRHRLARFQDEIAVGLNVSDAGGDVERQLIGQSHG